MAGTDTCHIGTEIKKARRASGRSISDIAEQICVRPCYLRAIEEGKREALPERTFAVGFVKAYASAVGMDGHRASEAFKLKFSEQSIDMPDFTGVIVKPRSRFMPSWMLTLIAPIGLAVSWLAMASSNNIAAIDMVSGFGGDPAILVAEDISDNSLGDTAQTPIASLTKSAEPKANIVLVAASAPALKLQASEETWLQLQGAEGQLIFNGVLAAGEVYGGKLGGVLLTTSNAGGLQLSFDENALPSLGGRGVIVEDIALDLSQLGKRVAENEQHP